MGVRDGGGRGAVRAREREIGMLKRAGIVTTSAELLLVRMCSRWTIVVEPSLRPGSPKTGIFAEAGGDFRRLGRAKPLRGKVETKGQIA